MFNPRTYTQIHTPPWYKGWGLMKPGLPRVFDVLQYFETILPSVESLWSQQDELYFMSGGAAGGLWRHQQWSSSWPPSWILPRIRNQVKTARNCNFLCLTWKITHKYVVCIVLLLLLKEVEKNMYFHSKMAWPPATYDVISRNHSNWPSLNVSQNVCKG